MVKQIHIENYKSVQSLDIELGRLNVFIGANGCGKTNILEAIALGSAAAADKLDHEFLGSRGIRVTEPKWMKSGFKNEFFDKEILIKFSSFEHWLSLVINYYKDIEDDFFSKWEAQMNTSEDEDRKFIDESLYEHLPEHTAKWETIAKSLKSKILIINLRLSTFLIFSPENYFLRRFEGESQIKPLGIRGEGLFSHLVELIQKPKIFNKIKEHLQLMDWFDDFEIPNDLYFNQRKITIKDRFIAEGLQYFDQRSANEGFLYLLFYVTLFISPYTPKFFAIDNIDNSLNPKLCSELTKMLAQLAKEHDKQAILTTHNPAVLDGLNLNDQEQRLFVIYRNADGHTKAQRILKKEVPNGMSPVKLSEQFLRGYLGGLNENF
ncbi:MAG: AAA family ATPase [Saprospiraceae bacterium]